MHALKEAAEVGPESESVYFMFGRAYPLLSDRRELFAGDRVRESFRKYLALKPQEGFPHLLCALEQLREGKRSDAIRALERALQLDPELAEAWLELGRIHFDEARYREAARALERAVEIQPSLVAAHYRLASSYQRLGQNDKARLAWETNAQQQRELQTKLTSARSKSCASFTR